MENYTENPCYGQSHVTCCDAIIGNNADLCINKDDCEVRVDIGVKKIKTIRIWGQILDCNGYAIENALVKLLKQIEHCGVLSYEGVSHTITDCNGFYQFDVPNNCDISNYKVIVSKTAYGKERVVSHTNCKPCKEIPCKPEPPCRQELSFRQNSHCPK